MPRAAYAIACSRCGGSSTVYRWRTALCPRCGAVNRRIYNRDHPDGWAAARRKTDAEIVEEYRAAGLLPAAAREAEA